MNKLVILATMVALALTGCEDKATDNTATDVNQSEDQKDSNNQVDLSADAQADTEQEIAPLPVCPDEIALADQLPCDCYGTTVTDPDSQIPDCQTDVVCCPVAQGLKCEDYEHVEPDDDVLDTTETDALVDDAVTDVEDTDETTADLVEVPVCPYEVDLSSKVPCTCKGTLVEDVKVAMPDCTKKVVCCPYSGVKCE